MQLLYKMLATKKEWLAEHEQRQQAAVAEDPSKLAEEIAKKTKRVEKVANHLEVKPQ